MTTETKTAAELEQELAEQVAEHKRLGQAYDEAARASSARERELERQAREWVAQKLDAEGHSSKVREARRLHCDADRRIVATKVALAKAKDAEGGAPFPVGARVVRTKVIRQRWGSPTTKLEYGVVELCEPSTELPANVSSHRLPRPGELFVRLFLANGKPAKAVARLSERDWETKQLVWSVVAE